VKLKHFILITAILITSMSAVYAVDYYPELGVDPFYSSLNPLHIDKDDVVNQNDSLIDMIKNKKKSKNDVKQDDILNQDSTAEIPEIVETQNIVETVDAETNIVQTEKEKIS